MWWWGGTTKEKPTFVYGVSLLVIPDVTHRTEGWWGFAGLIPPEPLPPKKKVTQTLWMVPAWTSGADIGPHFQRWLSPDDTIPPGAIETVQTRQIEQ